MNFKLVVFLFVSVINLRAYSINYSYSYNNNLNNNPNKIAPFFLLNDSIINNKPLNKIRKEKIIYAISAFPFPFGFVGTHRVLLGTKPWVPVVYVVTFGGCFGVIPLIDFFVITFSKDISKYEDNSAIFMWLK